MYSPMHVKVGERITAGLGAPFTVRESDLHRAVQARFVLLPYAMSGSRALVTYGELCRAVADPPHPLGWHRPLEVVTLDCSRRGEPTLACLVVNATTRRCGGGYAGDDAADRAILWERWSRRR